MATDVKFVTGDRVIITADDGRVAAHVVLASPNGRSLFLAFDAMLAGYAGSMPILQRDDGSYADLFGQRTVTLELMPPASGDDI